MKILRRYRTFFGGFMTALVALWQIAQPIQAATYIFDSDADGSSGITEAGGTFTWNLGQTTFYPGGTPPQADVATTSNLTTDIAQFGIGGTLASGATVNVATQSINGLIFGATTTNGYTLSAASASTLSIGASGITMNSSAQATTLGSANLGIALGANQIWTNDSSSTLTVAGAISGSGILTKNGTGTMVLNGGNTYAGITTINAGTVRLGSASALGSSAAADYTVVANGATLDLNGQTIAESFGTNAANGDGFTGAAGILTNSSATAASITGTINSDSGSTFIVDGTGDISLTRVARTNGTTGSPTITKNGINTLILEGTADNSAAAVIVNAGVVQLNKGGTGVRALGSASTIGVSGTLRLTTGQTNGDQLFSSVDLTTNGIFDLQGQDESFNNMTGTGQVTNGATNNASVLTLGENNGTFTWAGVIQDGAGTSTLSLTKMGTGVMSITSTNTYTGATQLSGSGGGFTLDFATATSSSNLISSSSSMTMNNTSSARTQTLTITGDTSQATSQTFNGTSVIGAGNRHQIVVTSGTGGTTLALGSFSMISGSFVDFVLPASGSITASNANTVLGPAATVNNGAAYAQILGGQVVAFTGDLIYQTGFNISALPSYTATSNLTVDATSTGNVLQASGTTGLNTVSFTDTSARMLTLGSGNTLLLGATGGILRGGSAGSVTIGDAVNSGTLTTGTASGADLILTNGNATGTLTINSVIANNAVGAVDVFSNGISTGVTVLAGTNTYTGTTTVQSGSLRLVNAAGLGSIIGGTNVAEGAALELSGGITIGDEALTIFGTGVSSNGALRNLSGTNTYTGLVTIAGSTTEIQTESGTILIFDRTGAATTSMTTPGNITLDTVGTGVMTFLDALVTTGASNPAITKAGNGTVNFTVANTWVGTGTFTLNDGVVRISNDNALGGTTAGTTVTNNAALELIGGINTNESITLDNAVGISTAGAIRNIAGNNFISGTITVDNGTGRINSDAGTLTLSAAAALQSESGGSRTAALGGAGVISITGVARDNPTVTNRLSISKDGTGTLILSGANTYTGTTAVTAGTVIVTSSSGLGATTNADVTVSANASLNYFAATDTALTVGGALTVTGGTNTTLGASIGSTTTSASIIVTEAATISNAAHKINLYGVSGTTPATGIYTLISGGAGSVLNPATAPTLGTVYNNTNFTVGAFSRTATTLSVDITVAAAIASAFWTGGLTGATNVWAASNGTSASNWVTSAAGGATALVPSSAADVIISASNVLTAPTATVLGANMGIKTLTISDITNGLGLNADGATLTITPGSAASGITMDAFVPASTIAANVALGAAQTWTNNSNNALTVNGAISGAFALTKAGTGTLTLGGVNTYSGGTTLSAGNLVASSSQALGLAANTLSLGGGTLDLASDISTTAHNTTIGGNFSIVSNRATAGVGITHTLGTLSIGASTLTVSAGANVTTGIAGVTFGATTLTGVPTLNVGSGSQLVLGLTSGGSANSSQASPGSNTSLIIKGAGSVSLSSASNTFTGDILVDGGGYDIDNLRDWGDVTVASSTSKTITLINGGRLNVTSGTLNPGAITTTSYYLVQIGSGDGTINTATGAVLQLDDAGQLFGSGTLTKTGGGTLSLRNQGGFSGALIIAAGTLQPSGGTGSNFGTIGAGTTIQSGAALNLNGISIAEAEPLTISGTGLAALPAGAITNSSGTAATFLGPVTLAGHATIGAAAGGTMTLSGGITGAFDLTIQNLAGGGTTLSTNSINNGGTITNSGIGTGTTTISASIGSNVTSIIQNSATSVMTLSGANIAYTGATTVSAGTLNITGGATGAPFSRTTLIVAGGATLNLFNAAGQQVNLSGAINLGTGTGTTVLGLELGALSAYDHFLSGVIAATTGTVQLNLTGITGFGAGNYDLLAAASGLSGATYSIGGISGVGGYSLGLSTSDTLVRLTSAINTGDYYWHGGVNTSWAGNTGLTTNFTNDLAGTINANGFPGTTNGVIFNTSGKTVTSLTTTLDGAFSIRDLTFNNQTGTGPLGTININAGTGGVLTITPAASTAGINVQTGAPAIINIGAPVVLGANQTWTVTDVATVLSSTGGISGTATLIKDGSGILQLSGTNTYVGTTTVNGGILQAGAANGFNGTSAHVIGASGTLRLNNFAAAIGSLAGSGTVENGASATATRVLTAGADNTSTIFSGALQNGGAFGLALTKVGSGSLTLSGVSTYTGNTSVTGGGALTLTGSLTGNGTTTAGSQLNIGNTGTGIFNLASGGTISNYFTFAGANAASAVAVYNQTGGTASYTRTGTGDNINYLSNNASGYGYLNITGGTTSVLGRFVAANAGTGVVYVGGTGTFNMQDSDWAMISSNAGANALGQWTVGPGGSIDRTTATNFTGLFLAGAGQYGVINVAGGSFTHGVGANATLRFGNGNGGNNNTALVNLAAGTLTIGANMSQSVGTSTGQNVYLAFAGGTLKAANTLTAALPGTVTGQTVVRSIFGAIDNTAATGDASQDFTGGLTVDTNGFAVGIAQSLDAATGDGVAQSSLTVASGGSGYVGAPAVQFTGGTLAAGGSPASGYALISGGQVTGIVITSPGQYTIAPTVALTGGGGTGASVTVGTLVANSSGGLTKMGAGTLTLSGPNTYTGGTFINAGTLALGANDVLANVGAVTISGGTFDVATFSDTVGVVTLQSGSISGSTGVLTSTASYELQNGTVSAILAGAVGVNKTTAGTVTLIGANTFSGVVNVTAGTLDFSTSGNLGNASATNTIMLGGGTLRYNASGALNLTATRVVTLTGGTTSTVEVTQSTGNLQVIGGFSTSAAANLVKTGLGNLTVTGALNLTGGNLTVSEGTYTGGLAASGISGLTVGASSNLQLVDSAAVGATLTALTLSSGARLGFELGAPGTNDSLTLVGAATLTGGTITLDFYNLGGLATGTYNLISAGSGLLGGGASYVLGSAPAGFNYSINQADNLISVGVSILSNRYWTNSQTTGSWNTLTGGTLSNFSTDLSGAINSGAIPTSVDTVIFSATSVTTSPVNTTLDAAITIDSLIFNANPTGGTFIIAPGTGGSLTLAPVSSINGIYVGNNGGAVTISAPLTAGAVGGATSQTWFVDGTGTSSLSISGNILFTDRVNKTGAGSLTLSGNNSGAGGLTLGGGTLNIGSATALGTGIFTVESGTTFANGSAGALILSTNNAQFWNGSFTFGGTQNLNMAIGTVTLGNNLTATIANTLTIGGNIDDGASTYTLSKAGAGILALNGNNTFGGGINLNAGTLNIGSATALGTGAFTINGGTFNNTSGGTPVLTTNNAQFWNSNFTFTGTNSLNLGTGSVALGATPTITVTANTLTVGGSIDGAFGITKTGAGALTLTGLSATASNNYLGMTTLNSGTMNINTAASLTGGLTFGSTAGNTTFSTLNLPNGATFGGALLVQTNSATANNIILAAGKTLTVNNSVTIGYNPATGTAQVPSRLNISGGGAVVITGSTIAIGVDTAAANSSYSSAGTFDVTATSSFTATVTNLNVGVGTNNAPVGNLLLSNTANTITATNVNIGVTGANNGSGPSTMTLGTGTNVVKANSIIIGSGKGSGPGILKFASQALGSAGTLTVTDVAGTGGANITVGTNTTAGTAGSAIGTLDLRGHSVNVTAGTLLISNFAQASSSAVGTTGTVSFDTGTFNATTLNLGAYSTAGVALTTGPSATLNIGSTGSTGVFTVSGTTTVANNTASTASGTNLTGTINVAAGTLNLGNTVLATKNGANTGTTTGTINVTGGAVVITAGSTFTMAANATAAGTVNGTVNITGGSFTSNVNMLKGASTGTSTATITLDGATALLDLTGHNIGAASPSTVIFNAQTGTLQNVAEINGGAGLIKSAGSGTNTLILEGVNTYTGGTTISDGTLQVGSGSTTGTLGNGNVTNNATLTLNRSNSYTVNQNIVTSTNSGKVIQAGSGTTILGGTNSYEGGTDVNNGVLQVNSASALGTLGTIDFGGGTLQYTSNNTADYSSRIANSSGAIKIDTNGQTVSYASALANTNTGGLTKEGSGTLTLSAANLYTGTTTVNNGVLLANNVTGSATGTGAINIGAAGTLGGTGTVGTTGLTVAAAGTVRPGDPGIANGIGTLAVTGTVALNINGGSVLDFQLTHTNGAGSATIGANLSDQYTLDWNYIINTAGQAGEIPNASDHLNISGILTINSSNATTVNFSAAGPGTFAAGMAWDLMDWGSIVNNTPTSYSYSFAALNAELSGSNLTLDTSQFYSSGYVGVVSIVPEPSRMLLLMFGLMALFFRRRRSSSAAVL